MKTTKAEPTQTKVAEKKKAPEAVKAAASTT